MSRELLESLLTDLGAEVGLPDLALDEHDYCCLVLDDLAINLETDGEELFLYANLGPLPGDEAARTELLAELLDANYFWQGTGGGVLAASREEGFVLFLMRSRVDALDVTGLRNMLENFANVAATWMARLGGGEGAPPAGEQPDPPPPSGLRV
jgi:hypothetical protein